MFQFHGPGRENWPKIDTTPLAIISIHLEGIVDSTSLVTYHHLAPWLQGNLVLVDLVFNFDDPQNNFQSQLDSMLQEFEEGNYKEYIHFYLFFLELNISIRWTRFLVVISTHSDPRTGDLHIAPGNTGSVPVDEVSFLSFFVIILNFWTLFQLFQVIFPERFHKILQRDKKNILNLLACGALSSRPKSREDVKNIASKYVFFTSDIKAKS